ncbi:uncharacterized protein TNCV_1678681 [Trichonephila clavipes]|nr:uncharacterized protein TNCV_1678681 [Trichonephila clavipes]
MGTRLRKLKLVYSKKKLSDGKTIGGKGRLTDSLIDKLAYYYGNAIRCNSTSVKEMRKAIWAVWGHSCSTDDEPMHWFCPTNPNTWCKYNAAINNNLQNYKHKPSVAKAVRDAIKPVFADLSHPALLKKCLGEIFGLKINRNVCVSLAERDNRRIFTSRQRCLESSFEVRRAKEIKKSKEIELFQEQEGISYDPGAFYHILRNHYPKQLPMVVITTLIPRNVELNSNRMVCKREDLTASTRRHRPSTAVKSIWFFVDRTIEDAPVYDAVSMIVASMVSTLRVHAAANVVELVVL